MNKSELQQKLKYAEQLRNQLNNIEENIINELKADKKKYPGFYDNGQLNRAKIFVSNVTRGIDNATEAITRISNLNIPLEEDKKTILNLPIINIDKETLVPEISLDTGKGKLTMYANHIDGQIGMFLETKKENYYDLVLVELDKDKLKEKSYENDLSLYVWENPYDEDYTHKVDLDIETFEDVAEQNKEREKE